MYIAIYQALSGDANRTALHKEFPDDFFDLIIIDECHRGSARDD
jgi:type I restriction enzyme R subunit